MTTLEQRIKEAAEKAIIAGLASQGKRYLGVEYLSAHTALEDFEQLITPESIKALLAEKAAALESLKARAEQWEQIAREFRKDKTGRHGWHGEFVDINGPETCDICKAYDALSGPREGEQDAGNS